MSRSLTIIKESVPYTKNVTINEYKAPTDDSIKIITEIREKTIAEIFATHSMSDNNIKAIIIYFISSCNFDKLEYRVKFSFNNKEYSLNGAIDRCAYIKGNRFGSEDVAKKLGVNMCYLIAQEVFKEIPDLANSFLI